MSTNSNDQGRAYEFVWMAVLFNKLSPMRETRILCNSSLEANKRAWESLDIEKKYLFLTSANAAVDTLLELEPRMEEPSSDALLLRFQKDEEGEKGDVRDIVIRRNNIQWEIGLSIKHNHMAVKHSRLSHILDFGNEWYDMPCSDTYWNDVAPIFNTLNRAKANKITWADLPNKEDQIYIPLLNAFLREVNRAYEKDRHMVIRMFEYLVGIKDYHKIVSEDRRRLTLIHTFNLHGTLGKPSTLKVSAFDVPTVEMPSSILAIRLKPGSKTTGELYMDNGWAFSFRIHNASTKVQPSLKFDVQFISTPASVLNIECRWYK